VQSAPARPPEKQAGGKRDNAKCEHERHRRRQPEVHERRQQDHRRSHAREDGEANAERRACQEQDSRPQWHEPGQRERDADESADHRSTSQSRPKRQARCGRIPAHGATGQRARPSEHARPRRRGAAQSRSRPSESSPSARRSGAPHRRLAAGTRRSRRPARCGGSPSRRGTLREAPKPNGGTTFASTALSLECSRIASTSSRTVEPSVSATGRARTALATSNLHTRLFSP
jgi:Protein involved in mRNA turnover and stability